MPKIDRLEERALWDELELHPSNDAKHVLADWYEEGGKLTRAHALRWCAKTGKWPQFCRAGEAGWYTDVWIWHMRRSGQPTSCLSRPLFHALPDYAAGGPSYVVEIMYGTLPAALDALAQALAHLQAIHDGDPTVC